MENNQSEPTVLVFDDEKNIRKSIEFALANEGIRVLTAHEPGLALRILSDQVVDLLLLDIKLGEIDGLTFLKKIRSEGYSLPTIFISGHASLSEVAQAVKIGGYDFLEKPFSADKLLVTVKRCLEYEALINKLTVLEASVSTQELIGQTGVIQRVKTEAIKVAKTDANVFITGDSGSGKELVANIVHSNSKRSQAPFIKVNCSAIPENLIESELFGYEKGAFSGAHSTKKGYFEQAHRGTIFLDEVADLSLSAQAKVLRIFQDGEIQKVGSEKKLNVDIRIISGTHKNLKECVAEGSFREDLLYRLNVVPIKIPSLRERAEDLPLLIHYFIKQLSAKNNIKHKQIDEEAIHELTKYHWPGNVRELINVLERIIIMGSERITVADLPEEILATSDDDICLTKNETLREFRNKAERLFIINTLKRQKGNITKTAQELGVGRTYLHKRMGQLNIGKNDYFI